MTRCAEFYEKLERDGNFCGLPTRFFKEAMEYWSEYRKDTEASNVDIQPITEREWFRQRRNGKENPALCTCVNPMDRHHVSSNKVVFIPAKIHESIDHNLETGKNMDLMNSIVYAWVFYHGGY